MITVVIADDQQLVREGFRAILEGLEDLEVVGEASDGAEAIQLTLKLNPDVVLMDIRMPEIDGLEATRRLAQGGSQSKILILTTFNVNEYVYEALKAGASGFLLKDVPRDQLVNAIRVVAGGDALLAPSITRRLIEEFVSRPRLGPDSPSQLLALTERERDVLRLIAQGRSNAEIADDLYISEATVKSHVTSIFSKLGIRDRAQAVVAAYESGLVEPGADAAKKLGD